ncbi:hypothetical protein [Larkinella soli]|uniref:hypothetical protein n=1 Tax=Larkinella soli TaxID=1770527 RepID=UPI000FFBE002|nr:hypothetical protein [Larkinella soli]
MENQTNMAQSNATMNPNGSSVSDLDFSTTATVRNMESSDEPSTTNMNPSTGAGYPGNMSTGGYGGSANGPDDEEEYDEEELTVTDDDDDEDLTDDEDDEEAV